MKTVPSIREEVGLRSNPIKHHQKLLAEKIEFVKKCEDKERQKLKLMAQKHSHYSDPSTDGSSSRFHWHNWPDETDVMKARHDHVCFHSTCKKKIKRGEFYFRRSFGQVWTIKACSIECFCWRLP